MGGNFLVRARATEIHFTVTAGSRGGKRQATFFEETRKQGNTNLETTLYRYTNLETALYVMMITFYCAKRSFRLSVPENCIFVRSSSCSFVREIIYFCEGDMDGA